MKNILTASTIITLILFATGCNLSNSSSEPGRVQVVMQSASSSVAKFSMQKAINDSLELTEVRFYIEEMELESAQEDSIDFETENFIVELPLDGSPFVITEKVIPDGLYDEFEMEIERPDEDDSSIDDPDFWDDSGRYSIVIRGLWNGEEFIYRSEEDFELEMEMNPPLEVTGQNNGFTLMVEVDINQWFTASDGSPLNPNMEENRDDIDESIENSFDVLEDLFDDDDDDDDDGDDD